MQRIIHQYKNKSPVFMLIEELYTWISDYTDDFDDVIWLDESFRSLCDIFQENLYTFISPKFRQYKFPVIENVTNRPNEITVCLSGGKDSAAAAYYYKNLGYTVHLYHATGVNKAYGDEKNAAKRIADYLGCDLFIDRIQLAGTHKFIEHPLKNYVIANGAIHYALAMGYSPVIAFGNFNQSHLDDNPFEVCAGDCVEMWEEYKKIISTVLPTFSIELPLKTNADTFSILAKNWELLNLAVSCMSPFRFREHWKHRTEQRYNVRVLDNRCGCCWKDCLEAMWLMDTDRVAYDAEYYSHCFEILERTIFKETGKSADCVEDIWNQYMFYPITQSKQYPSLLDRKLKRRFS